jgi:hypothetical protein
MGKSRIAHMVLVKRPDSKRLFENLNVDWRIILKWIVNKWVREAWLRIGKVAGSSESGNKPSGSIKCGNFLG